MNESKKMIVELAQVIEQEENSSFDLWSWLPSASLAKTFHGDYSTEHRPSVAEVMQESADFLSLLKAKSVRGWIEGNDGAFFQCPCDEHDLTKSELVTFLEDMVSEFKSKEEGSEKKPMWNTRCATCNVERAAHHPRFGVRQCCENFKEKA